MTTCASSDFSAIRKRVEIEIMGLKEISNVEHPMSNDEVVKSLLSSFDIECSIFDIFPCFLGQCIEVK